MSAATCCLARCPAPRWCADRPRATRPDRAARGSVTGAMQRDTTPAQTGARAAGGEPRTPLATYRLQLHAEFGFAAAAAVVPYLRRLGIGDCYTSPLLQARHGSGHGYDIRRSQRAQRRSRRRRRLRGLRRRAGGARHGPAGRLRPQPHGDLPARQPLVARRAGERPLLAVRALLRHRLAAGQGRAARQGAAADPRRPVRPRARARRAAAGVRRRRLLAALFRAPAADQSAPGAADPGHRPRPPGAASSARATPAWPSTAVSSPRCAICRCTPRPSPIASPSGSARRKWRGRASPAWWRRRRASPQHIARLRRRLQPARRRPRRLHALLEAQPYRLAYWRTAAHEINYRRFFDINELAGLRMEDPAVFAATHALLLELLASGRVTGVRLDHVDGLYDPAGYLAELQNAARAAGAPAPLYLAVEKILGRDEPLPASWPVAGTTGYDFLNDCIGLFVDPRHERTLQRIYRRFTAQRAPLRRRALRVQGADHGGVDGQRAEHAGGGAQPALRARPAHPRLHPQQPARDAA